MIDHYFDGAQKRSIAIGFLLAVFGLLYLSILGQRPLFIPDEPRYGEIAREMLVSGDWIVPRLNGLLYFEKPPLGHWLNAGSLSVFGETPFAVRFSNLVATAVAAVVVFITAKFFVRSRAVPYLATFIFLTTLEVQAIGTFSVLDPIFAALLNSGILSMAIAANSAGGKRSWLTVLAGTLFGLAFLAKGLLAFALPTIVLTPWLIIRRDYTYLVRYAWLAVVSAILVVLPWGLAIHIREPDFWNYFFWIEHVQRFASISAQHKEPFYYFVLFLPVLAFPWVFLLPVVVQNLRRASDKMASDGALLLLTFWAVLPFVFFSIASGKLSTYILPCFVPFSVLVAVGLNTVARRTPWNRVWTGLAAAAALTFLAALIAFVAKGEELAFAPHESSKKLALYGSLIFAIATLVVATVTDRLDLRLVCVGCSIMPFMVALPLSMPMSALAAKAPVDFIKDTYAAMPSDTVIVTNGSLVRAVSWSTKRTDVFVIENGGETTYGLAAPDGVGRFLSPQLLQQLLGSQPSVLILCKGQCTAATSAVIPDHSIDTSYGNFFAHHIWTPAAKVEQ